MRNAVHAFCGSHDHDTPARVRGGGRSGLVDFLEEDLAAAVATNSWECCGWKKADALAAFFRADGGGNAP